MVEELVDQPPHSVFLSCGLLPPRFFGDFRALILEHNILVSGTWFVSLAAILTMWASSVALSSLGQR
jgi:hypothetical protein